MPVRVRLREAPLQQLGLGLGWSSEGGPRSTFEHQHRKPFGQALRSRLRMAWARDSQALDAELSTHPRADLRRLHAALRWEREQGTEAPYRQTSLRFGQTLETPAYDRSLLLEALASHAGFGASGSTADSLACTGTPPGGAWTACCCRPTATRYCSAPRGRWPSTSTCTARSATTR